MFGPTMELRIQGSIIGKPLLGNVLLVMSTCLHLKKAWVRTFIGRVQLFSNQRDKPIDLPLHNQKGDGPVTDVLSGIRARES